MSKLKNYLLNTRPYSWVDIILLGLLAESSTKSPLELTITNFCVAGSLLSLWFFYNLALERRHAYAYRGETSLLPALISLFIPVLVSIRFKSYHSIIFIVTSTVLIYIYLQKNKTPLLGKLSAIIRGLIQTCYFIYVLFLLNINIQKTQIILFIAIFLIYIGRAIMGDVRDIKHNALEDKNTIPVIYGEERSRRFAGLIILTCCFLLFMTLHNWLITLPLMLLAVTTMLYKNGYILHQLSIITTMFFSILLIGLFTNQNLEFLLLIYTGLYLNMIFYPELKRKSNPQFV